MQTECPHCNTIFRIEESALEQADGQVRCGHCLAVFTADNPYSNIRYHPDNPAVAIIEKTLTEPEDFITNTAEEHIVADVIPPELRAESRTGKTRFGFAETLLLTLFILIGISTIFLQYAYYNRDSLVKSAEFRPALSFMCQQLNCTLPSPKDLNLISLTSKNIFSHPNVENALMVSAGIINQASFAQQYPIIELRFENVRGETIAGRRFSPREYLGIPENQFSKMQPDAPININLEIKDPGNDMVSYEFTFL